MSARDDFPLLAALAAATLHEPEYAAALAEIDGLRSDLSRLVVAAEVVLAARPTNLGYMLAAYIDELGDVLHTVKESSSSPTTQGDEK